MLETALKKQFEEKLGKFASIQQHRPTVQRKTKTVVKPRRERLAAQLSMLVDGTEQMEEEIKVTNNFEQERR